MAVARYHKAQRGLQMARERFDQLVCQGQNTTEAAYELHQAQVTVERTRREARCAIDIA